MIARSCSLATAERFLHHDTAVSNLPTFVIFAGMLPAVISGASSASASAPRTFVTLGLLNRNSGANAAPLAQLACAIPLCCLGEIELDASFPVVHGDYGIAYFLQGSGKRPGWRFVVAMNSLTGLVDSAVRTAAATPMDPVKLISSEGHEFIVDRKCATISGTIKSMLTGPGTPSGMVKSGVPSCG
jgi:hypothetical protein